MEPKELGEKWREGIIKKLVKEHDDFMLTNYAIGKKQFNDILTVIFSRLDIFPRRLILDKIDNYWEAINALSDGSYEEAHDVVKELCKLKAFIELLEAWDCGQCGGFDEGQRGMRRKSLEERTKWVKNKVVTGYNYD